MATPTIKPRIAIATVVLVAAGVLAVNHFAGADDEFQLPEPTGPQLPFPNIDDGITSDEVAIIEWNRYDGCRLGAVKVFDLRVKAPYAEIYTPTLAELEALEAMCP